METLPTLALLGCSVLGVIGFFWSLFSGGRWERPEELDQPVATATTDGEEIEQ